MPLDPKDPRLSDPKFQEFEDMVGHVLDKRDAQRKADDEALKQKAETEKKSKVPFWPF